MKQIHGRYLLQPNKDFPADCEMLDYLQTNAHVVSIIGNIAGNKAVLLGCDPMDNGARRAEGYVFLHTREHPEGGCCIGKAAQSAAACTSSRR